MPPARPSFRQTASAAPAGQRAVLADRLVDRDPHRDAVANLAQRLDAVDRLLDQLEPRRRERLRSRRTASSTSQAPLASSADAISGPAAARTAARRPASSPIPTLTFTHA